MKLRLELCNKKYDAELESLQHTFKERIKDCYYELMDKTTSEIIDAQVKSHIYADQAKSIFEENTYKSPLIDKTGIIGNSSPSPGDKPQLNFRLPHDVIFEDVYRTKTNIYRNQITKELKPKFDEAYRLLKKSLRDR